MPKYEGRLELTWTNKHLRLLARDDGNYEWLKPSDYRVAEVRLLHDGEAVGHVSRNRVVDNLLIRGDALHGLTSLTKLPEFAREYLGKVKLAYLDPPFNTGQAFEHYDDALEHSVWLTMMRDRLVQIRELLAASGSVWVHLDDVEVHRCRIVLDEVFGTGNFAGCVVWQKADSARNDAKGLSTDQDYILVYAKTKNSWQPNRMARTAEMNSIYSSPDGDETPWFDDNPTAPGAKTHQGMVYAIQSPFTGELQYPAPGRCWFADQQRLLAALTEWAPYERRDIGDAAERARRCGVAENDVRRQVPALMLAVSLPEARAKAQRRYQRGIWPELIFRSEGQSGIGRKRYQPDTGVPPRTLWLSSEVGHNRTAKAEIKALFPGEVPFSTPKPERLLHRIIQIATEPDDIVLDCFAGSGTTAAVAHKLGRRWLAIEREETTVTNYTRPRLVHVVEDTDHGGVTGQTGWQGGGGFRVLDVAPSMFEVDDGLVFLAEDMTNGRLAEATAAQLGFEHQDDPPFTGRKGRMRLAVIDGVVNESVVQLLVRALPENERVVICGTGIDSEARVALRVLRPGSTLRKIPAALLGQYRTGRVELAVRPASPSARASA